MKATDRRVLIIGADGLRPDLVTEQTMPNYTKLIRRGTLFTEFRSVFPTHTRVNMTTLSTGVLPGTHGVVNNLMLMPGTKGTYFDTSDAAAIMQWPAVSGEPFVLAPSLGDRLVEKGYRLMVTASSTPGASLLWNTGNPGHVLNPNSDYGRPELMNLHDKLGRPAPEQGRRKLESTAWAAQAFLDVVLDDPINKAMVLWLTEPDASLHFHGAGSDEALEAMKLVDDIVGEVFRAIETRGLREAVDVLLISDHGHSTVLTSRSLAEHLERTLPGLGIRGEHFRAAGDFIYAEPSASMEEASVLAGWLLDQSWADLVFTDPDRVPASGGLLPIEIALGEFSHGRKPLIAVSPTWSHAVNGFGVPGTVSCLTSYSPLRSTHGTASPYDMRAFCLGVGTAFEEGAVCSVPCATVDIAPTVMDLIGMEAAGFDGGSLLEAAATLPGMVTYSRENAGRDSESGADLARVGGRNYFPGSSRSGQGPVE